jgi:hypothetical protein
MAQTIMAIVQGKYDIYANTHRQPFEQFKIGDKIWLNLKKILLRTGLAKSWTEKMRNT